jgi:hypothetical protein
MTEQGQQEKKDLFARLTDAGEDAIQRLNDVPGGRRVVDIVGVIRERADELQKRVLKIDELEKRVAALERKVGKSETRPKRTRSRARTSGAPTTPTPPRES